MQSSRDMIHNNLLIVIRMITIVLIIGTSTGRELRPSEHGLEYSPPVEKRNSPEMKAFFGTSAAAVSKNTTSSGVALPRAMNSNDTSWWSGEGNGGGGGNHLKHVLLVTSLACGVAGVCLFVVSGFIFFVRRKRQRASSFRDDSGDVSK